MTNAAKHWKTVGGKGFGDKGFGGKGLGMARIALALVFAVAAGMKLGQTEFEVAGFARFGYAPWFMIVVALGQLLGAAMLLTRGFHALGALGLAVCMVGAVASHLRAGDPVFMAVPAFVLLVMLLGLAYARRAELVALARLDLRAFADASR